MATLLKLDGTSVEVTGTGKAGKNGKAKITLEDAYRLIDCDNVETYPITGRRFIVIDGEGAFTKSANRAATILWAEKYGFGCGALYGNVLVTQGEGWG